MQVGEGQQVQIVQAQPQGQAQQAQSSTGQTMQVMQQIITNTGEIQQIPVSPALSQVCMALFNIIEILKDFISVYTARQKRLCVCAYIFCMVCISHTHTYKHFLNQYSYYPKPQLASLCAHCFSLTQVKVHHCGVAPLNFLSLHPRAEVIVTTILCQGPKALSFDYQRIRGGV